jgi:hypothetical protein
MRTHSLEGRKKEWASEFGNVDISLAGGKEEEGVSWCLKMQNIINEDSPTRGRKWEEQVQGKWEEQVQA